MHLNTLLSESFVVVFVCEKLRGLEGTFLFHSGVLVFVFEEKILGFVELAFTVCLLFSNAQRRKL